MDSLKTNVLAKCADLCPDLNIHVFGKNRIEQRADGYSMWNAGMSIVVYVSEDMPYNALNWVFAAKILGIQDDQSVNVKKSNIYHCMNGKISELCCTKCDGRMNMSVISDGELREAIGEFFEKHRVCGVEVQNG